VLWVLPVSTMVNDPKTYFYGCLNGHGHFLFRAGVSGYQRAPLVERYGPDQRHIDGSLAPRVYDGASGQGQEAPQGLYTIAYLDNGYTAMAWWDRTHGETRFGSNSIVLMEGEHTAEELIAALRTHWPKVLDDMAKAGVVLKQVFP